MSSNVQVDGDDRSIIENGADLSDDSYDYSYEDIKPIEGDEPLHHIFTDNETKVPVPPYFNQNHTVKILLDEIAKSPDKRIPYSRFMDICLFNEHDGYYVSGKVEISNRDGMKDFKTSPEVSDMFGGSYALTMHKVWVEMGKPENFELVEMGAGLGSLAEGFLEWSKKLDTDFYKAILYKIVDYSPVLISKQKERLKAFEGKITWIQGSAHEIEHEKIVGGFLFNELYDAFPVERLTRLKGEIKQKYVSADNGVWSEEWREPTKEVLGYLSYLEKIGCGLNIRESVEEPINIYALTLQKVINKCLVRGAVINTDYGWNGDLGVRNEVSVRFFGKSDLIQGAESEIGTDRSLLSYYSPGDFDITANVNFKPLAVQSELDGLQVDFNGLQKDFIIASGMPVYIREIVEKIDKGEVSWKELIETGNKLIGYRWIMSRFDMGFFHTLILIKGIGKIPQYYPTPFDLTQQSIAHKRKLNIGIPLTEVIFDYGNESRSTRITDDKGIIEYPFSELINVILDVKIDSFNRKILNFKQNEELRNKAVRGLILVNKD